MLRVLCADDDSLGRKVVGNLLSKWGFEPILARDGIEAWEILQQDDPPSLALLDWVMPGLSGPEICNRVRGRNSGNYTYVILLTGKSEKADLVTGLSAGADDYIVKPVFPMELQARLQTAVRLLTLQSQISSRNERLQKLHQEAVDMTLLLQQKNAELEALHDENLLLLSSIPSVFICLDGHDRITQWNCAAEKIFGKSAESMIGRHFLSVGLQWDWGAILESSFLSQNENKPVQISNVPFCTEEGKQGFLDVTLNSVSTSHCEEKGLLLLATDVTNRTTLELELERARRLESIGQLAAGIAHEMNTPMQYISHNVEYLKNSFLKMEEFFDIFQKIEEGVAPEIAVNCISLSQKHRTFLRREVPRALQQTLEGISRVTTILGAMRDFTRAGSNEPCFIDINTVVQSSIDISQHEWKYCAEFNCDLEPRLPDIPTYRGELGQVLVNLFVNAAHAIEAKFVNTGIKGVIKVRTFQEGDNVIVAIEDNGTGIPKQYYQKIFDPFFTTKDVGKGTGQGLTIVHGIVVEHHKGTIRFESKEGVGTTFFISLPVLEHASVEESELRMQ